MYFWKCCVPFQQSFASPFQNQVSAVTPLYWSTQNISFTFCSKDFHLVKGTGVFTLFFVKPAEKVPLYFTLRPNALLKTKQSVLFMNNTFIYKQLISLFVTNTAKREVIRRREWTDADSSGADQRYNDCNHKSDSNENVIKVKFHILSPPKKSSILFFPLVVYLLNIFKGPIEELETCSESQSASQSSCGLTGSLWAKTPK